MDNAELASQRYVMTEGKEHEMFVGSIMHRVDRISKRLDNQSSLNQEQLKLQKWQQLQPTLDKLGRGRLENQSYDPSRRKSIAN